MIYNVKEKIEALENGIELEKLKVKRLQKELCDWTLPQGTFINKKKVLDSTKTFIKKLQKDLDLLNKK